MQPNNKRAKTLSITARIVFTLATALGIYRLANPDTRASGILVILVGAIGISLTYLPTITRKIWQTTIPTSTIIILYTFIFLALVPGEILHFYYNVWWWDFVLHIFSGFGISYITYQILQAIFPKSHTNNRQVITLTIITLLTSLGTAVIWEATEFTIDSAFATNMQKFIPPQFLPNDTGSVQTITATDQELSNYYRQPSGYRYALIDTMQDHVIFLVGTLIWLTTRTIAHTQTIIPKSPPKKPKPSSHPQKHKSSPAPAS